MPSPTSRLTISFVGQVTKVDVDKQPGQQSVTLSNNENLLHFELEPVNVFHVGDTLHVVGDVEVDLGFDYGLGRLAVFDRKQFGFHITTLESVRLMTCGEAFA